MFLAACSCQIPSHCLHPTSLSIYQKICCSSLLILAFFIYWIWDQHNGPAEVIYIYFFNFLFWNKSLSHELLRETGLRWWPRQSSFNPTSSLCRSAAVSSSLNQSEEPIYQGHAHAASLEPGPQCVYHKGCGTSLSWLQAAFMFWYL